MTVAKVRHLLLLALTCAHCLHAAAELVTLQNNRNFTVVLTTTGASIVKLLVPTCSGQDKQIDVALGYGNVTGYAMNPHPSFGATVGRVANRISNAQFTLDSVTYKLLANDGTNSIHGGAVRWSQQQWKPTVSADRLSATFHYTSVHGESGFPGTVNAAVTYSIPANGTALAINTTATTDKATPLNIINHNYFNLKGSGNGDILDTIVQIPSLFFTPAAGPGSVAVSGAIASVKHAAGVYDFTVPKPIRKHLALANGGGQSGYDVNYLVRPRPISLQDTNAKPPFGWMPGHNPQVAPGLASKQPFGWMPGHNPQVAPGLASKPLTLAAVATEPSNGLRLKVFTNAPGLQFYTSNPLTGKPSDLPVPGKGGVQYKQYAGFCLEAQALPDAINKPGFPSNVVRPGEVFNNRVTYDFSCALCQRDKCV